MSILAVNTIYKHEKSLCNSFINFHFSNVCAQKSNYNLLIGTYTQKCENKGIYTILILTQEILVLKILPKMW
jgi:hypothetical protein